MRRCGRDNTVFYFFRWVRIFALCWIVGPPLEAFAHFLRQVRTGSARAKHLPPGYTTPRSPTARQTSRLDHDARGAQAQPDHVVQLARYRPTRFFTAISQLRTSQWKFADSFSISTSFRRFARLRSKNKFMLMRHLVEFFKVVFFSLIFLFWFCCWFFWYRFFGKPVFEIVGSFSVIFLCFLGGGMEEVVIIILIEGNK